VGSGRARGLRVRGSSPGRRHTRRELPLEEREVVVREVHLVRVRVRVRVRVKVKVRVRVGVRVRVRVRVRVGARVRVRVRVRVREYTCLRSCMKSSGSIPG